MNAAQILNIIILVAVFGLVFSLWCICVFVWLGQYLVRLKKIQQRLGLAGRGADESKILHLWRDTRQIEDKSQAKETSTFQDKLRRLANDAGWHASVQTVLLGLCGFALLAGVAVFSFTNSLLVALAAVLVVVCVFTAHTGRRIEKRAALFERQLVDALGVAARSLRAGHPLISSFRLISEEVGPPLGDIFYRRCQEQTLGLDVRSSIKKVAGSTANAELRLFATAVAVQLQSGGNLADLVDSLAAAIRARIRLSRRVRVLTAQTKLSARVLIVMPILLFLLLNIISPEYMEPLYNTSTGRYMLAGTIASVLLGWWVMKRLSELRY